MDATHCENCGRKLRKRYSRDRYPIGLLMGQPIWRHHRKECASCEIIYTAAEFDALVPPQSNYAYDLIVEVGLMRFRDHKQVGEIQEELHKRHRLQLPESTILHLAERFLDGTAAVHYASSERLRAWMMELCGGYVLHMDGTCEAGSAVIFLLAEAQTGLTLHTGKMATENASDIARLLRELVSTYGEPLATVRDLSKNIKSARDQVLPHVPDYICEYHLLAVIGEKLLKPHHDRLKKLQQKHAIRSSLTGRRRDLNRRSKPSESLNPQQYEDFLNAPSQSLNTADAPIRRQFIHTLIEWVQDSQADLHREYFPFDLPELAFIERCQQMLERLDDWLEQHPLEPLLRKMLESLRKILLPIREFPEFPRAIERLRKARDAFSELRACLRLEADLGVPLRRDTPSPDETTEDHCHAQRHLEAYRCALQRTIDSAQDPERVEDARKTKKQLDKYWSQLIGHELPVPGREDSILVARTNALPEHKFGKRKRGWHRQTGHETLARVLQGARHEQFLVDNLQNQDYLRILYDGDEKNIPARFAEHWLRAKQIHTTNKNNRITKKLYVPKEFLRKKEFFELMEKALSEA